MNKYAVCFISAAGTVAVSHMCNANQIAHWEGLFGKYFVLPM